jgi:hypothetical protein
MNLIIISVFLGIIFLVISFFFENIVSAKSFIDHNSKLVFAKTWFVYIFIINISLFCLVIYYNYHMTTTGLVGGAGLMGYPGRKGKPSPDCEIAVCVKNNTFPPKSS